MERREHHGGRIFALTPAPPARNFLPVLNRFYSYYSCYPLMVEAEG